MKCWNCSKELTTLDYGRGDLCPQCHRDTRVCKNCEHYDTQLNNSCRETQADRVVDKERSNFCDYFKACTPQAAGINPAMSAKNAAEALFKKKS